MMSLMGPAWALLSANAVIGVFYGILFGLKSAPKHCQASPQFCSAGNALAACLTVVVKFKLGFINCEWLRIAGFQTDVECE